MKKCLCVIVFALLIYFSTSFIKEKSDLKKMIDCKGNEKWGLQITRLMGRYRIPGMALGILKDGKIFSIQCYGYANQIEGKKIQENSIFQVGSLSKPMAAAAVVAMAEKKLLNLDAPIQDYLRRWRFPDSFYDNRAVTIRRVLNHTAGLSVSSYSGYAALGDLPDAIASLKGIPGSHEKLRIKYPPGKDFHYSGGGYTLLQLLVEDVSGESFHEHLKKQFFLPLGMNESSFIFSEVDKELFCRPHNVFGKPIPPVYFTEQAAAGLYTSITDLCTFVAENLIAYHETQNAALEKRLTCEENVYPVGYAVEQLKNDRFLAYHFGANPGWRSAMFLIPSLQSGLVILTNSDNGSQLIYDLSKQWVSDETGIVPIFYQEVEKERLLMNVLIMAGAIINLIVIYRIGKEFRNGQRKFNSCLKSIVKGALWLFLPAVWWMIFYTKFSHPHGWIISAFMPYGFGWISVLLFFWAIQGAILSNTKRKK